MQSREEGDDDRTRKDAPSMPWPPEILHRTAEAVAFCWTKVHDEKQDEAEPHIVGFEIHIAKTTRDVASGRGMRETFEQPDLRFCFVDQLDADQSYKLRMRTQWQGGWSTWSPVVTIPRWGRTVPGALLPDLDQVQQHKDPMESRSPPKISHNLPILQHRYESLTSEKPVVDWQGKMDQRDLMRSRGMSGHDGTVDSGLRCRRHTARSEVRNLQGGASVNA